jgi:hypothetical protein
MDDTVEVTISGSGLANLFAYDVTFGFEPRAFTIVSATAGTSGTTVLDKARNAVRLVHTGLGTSPSASGEHAVATLTLRAIGKGRTTVEAKSLTAVDTSLGTTTTPSVGSVEITVVKKT